MYTILERKLRALLNTLEDKINENRVYFKEIEVYFSNLNITTVGKFTFNDYGKLVFDYKKRKTEVEISGLADFIIENCKNCENCRIEYMERGSSISIWTEKGNVKIKYNNQLQIENCHDDVAVRSNRQYIIKANEAVDLLKEIGILTAEGKVKNDMIRKYNQIDHFVELIDGMLKDMKNKESITVLDCACGKSYLSFVLNYYIKEKLKKNCHFIGLDISGQVIESSKKMAVNLDYKNMEFHQMDIQNFEPKTPIDLVISLHGCDIATDMAIAAGINIKADAIVVIPCCQRELLNQYKYDPFENIIKHGILKARMADVLTDGVRGMLLETMGYEVSITEYISPLDTPKNIMIRAFRKNGKNRNMYEKYLELKEKLGIEPTLARLLNI